MTMSKTLPVASKGQADISKDLNLKNLMEDLLIILSDKERTVITKRFALDNKPKQTLDSIGKSFLVTRERVRQIEATALKKLQRNIVNSKLSLINRTALVIVKEHDGLISEKKLISKILSTLFNHSAVDGQIVRLALTVHPELRRVDSPRMYEPFWCLREISIDFVKKITNSAYKILKKNGDVIGEKQLLDKVASRLRRSDLSRVLIKSIIEVDFRFKKMDKAWGLVEWRHVSPKSIRDKINIILRKSREPLHFVEIANRITAQNFDEKPVAVQTVHNDLIRYPEFILVGRGLYGLKEWGFESGTVADVIARVLKEHGTLSKREIVEKVLKQRNVKLDTISLNLQKNEAFVRTGRDAYTFEETKWQPKPFGRGRRKVKVEA
jgi:hypothetical protein